MRSNSKFIFIASLLLFFLSPAGAGTECKKTCSVLPWDIGALFKAPQVYETQDCLEPGVTSIYYQGLPYEGNQTRVFAYYGFPKGASKSNKVPGVVLIHGGGGTAFAEWVRVWNQHGYAAIAMDLEGRIPNKVINEEVSKNKKSHQWAGPTNQTYADLGKPIKDQWMYHAVADVILANSLLRSFEQVDADKIGLTGISWGGIISNNVVGVDHRFSFAIPVYGCSYLYEMGNHYQKKYENHTPEHQKIQRTLWDGSVHLPRAKMPIFWIDGTNDTFFYPHKFYKSARTAPGTQNVYMKVEMAHSHVDGWSEPVIYAFADSITKGTPPLATVLDQGCEEDQAWVKYAGQMPVQTVSLIYTTDGGKWPDRKWHTISAELNTESCRAAAAIPEGTTTYYFNLTDQRGLTVSSDLVELLN